MIREVFPTPTPTPPPTPVPAIANVDDLFNAVCSRRKLPRARVGKAAVGRILMMLLQMLLSKCLRSCEMTSTIHAVYIYLMSPDLLIDVHVDREIFSVIMAEIDRSVARSEKARQRAAMRRAAREDAMSAPSEAVKPQEVPLAEQPEAIAELDSEPVSVVAVAPEAPAMAQPEVMAEDNTESAPAVPEAESPVTPVPDRPAAPKRRPKRDDDEVAFVYKPPQERPPVAYVIRDDESEPYDPYGVRQAIKMQTRYKNSGRYNHW